MVIHIYVSLRVKSTIIQHSVCGASNNLNPLIQSKQENKPKSTIKHPNPTEIKTSAVFDTHFFTIELQEDV